jgi:hypothetical protein
VGRGTPGGGPGKKTSDNALLVGAAYAYATSKLLGFVRAGLEGTTAGVKLSYSTQMLQRQIASAFLPAIEATIGKIQALTEWFRGLTGEQQRVIARFTGLGLAALAAAKVVPRLADALKVVGVGSPLLLVAGAIGAILARSGEGRAALVEFGDAAMGAFAGVVRIIQATLLPVLSGIADAIETVVMPVIAGLTEILDSAAGRWVIFGGLMVALGFKVVASFAAIRAAAAGLLGPFGLIVGAVLGIAAAIGAAGVHRGQSTQEKAREDIRVKAALQAEEEAEKARQRLPGGLFLPPEGRKVLEEDIERRRQARQEELIGTGNKEFDRILKRLGGAPGRSDVQPVPGAAVSPAELIKRIEAAALQKDTDAPKKTAENTKGIWDLLRNLGEKFGWGSCATPRPRIRASPGSTRGRRSSSASWDRMRPRGRAGRSSTPLRSGRSSTGRTRTGSSGGGRTTGARWALPARRGGTLLENSSKE